MFESKINLMHGLEVAVIMLTILRKRSIEPTHPDETLNYSVSDNVAQLVKAPAG